MKVVILAGGYGTRISEVSDEVPKPMIEIGGKPILWHIMKYYTQFGYNDFVILLGYKGNVIKEYFSQSPEEWNITLLDTGLDTMTGGRIKRAQKYIGNETFFLTYGDGLSNLNIHELLHFHKKHGKKMTVTSIQPEARFGALNIDNDNKVTSFLEKPKADGSWVNGGFFVCESSVLNYIADDSTTLEAAPLENLAKDGELYSFKHDGFWKCMDTRRDVKQLNDMWNSNNAFWKTWK